MPLLSLADKYNIKDLIALCVSFMMKSIALAGQKGFLIGWLQYTAGFNYHQQLTNELKNFLRLNITMVGYSRDFIDIDPNNLVSLLQQNDLVIKNEAKLFEIVERWLMMKVEQVETEESLSDEEKGSHLKMLIEAICVHIRYPMMTVSQLAAIPLKPIVAFNKDFFFDRVALAMSFHAHEASSIDCDYDTSFQYIPRLYTADPFCLEITVKEIQTVANYQNFGACFFSLAELPYNDNDNDERTVQWEIDFFPKGIRFDRAQLISVYYNPQRTQPLEVSESILRTVRLRCQYKANFVEDQRFRVS
jgi:BTB/POZ domain-containing protein 17